MDLKDARKILKRGGIGVMPTDTVYGILGRALSKRSVERIYRAKKRDSKKPSIILISSKKDLDLFSIHLDSDVRKIIRRLWPAKVSIIFSCPYKKFEHLHCGTGRLAFRIPANETLLKLLRSTGPLIAPSANLEGRPPAKNVTQAQKYFGDNVDFYVSGRTRTRPSTLVDITGDKVKVLRQGAFKMPKKLLK